MLRCRYVCSCCFVCNYTVAVSGNTPSYSEMYELVNLLLIASLDLDKLERVACKQ